MLTDLEIEKGNVIIESLLEQGIDLVEIKQLSKIENDKIADTSIIYNRINIIDADTWKKIIALGEQAGKLNSNEISTIKSVIQKLKSKSNIDLQRLVIVNEALDKVKRFGLKV